ncbi:MAG: hypothetical protein JJE53_03740 [Candidatus Pacebacteria bacterium]|nr:hypothetical protein [Candidatus Paceibacterota bacterium]
MKTKEGGSFMDKIVILINPFNIKRLVMLMLLVSILPIDTGTGYYYILRAVVFVSMIYLIIKEKGVAETKNIVLYVIVASLWNPIPGVMFTFGAGFWRVLDILVVAFIFKNSLNQYQRDNLLEKVNIDK